MVLITPPPASHYVEKEKLARDTIHLPAKSLTTLIEDEIEAALARRGEKLEPGMRESARIRYYQWLSSQGEV